MPVRPIIRSVFEILLPKMLPKTTVVSSLILATTFTTTSGNDVPIETKVRPIMSSDTLNLRANLLALSTTKLPPCQIRIHPNKNNKKFITVSIKL